MALSIYFTVYEIMTRALTRDSKSVSTASALLSGGVSGIFTWLIPYPFDFVKTLIQTDNIENTRYGSMMGYFREELAKGSIRRIYTGIEIMLVRAFVVNATGFACFEAGKRMVYPPSEMI